MATKNELLSWNQAMICREFGMDARTAGKRIAALNLGSRTTWSSLEVFQAMHGDIAAEKLRNATLDADLKQIQKEQELRNWIPAAAVDRIWTGIAAELTQRISQLDMPQEKKEDLCESLQAIPLDEYFSDTGKGTEEVDGEVSPTAQA